MTSGMTHCWRDEEDDNQDNFFSQTDHTSCELKLVGNAAGVTSCVFSPGGRILASASMDKTLRVWDTLSGEMLKVLKGHTEGVKACAFSPDGCSIISCGWDSTIREWDVLTGELLRTIKVPHVDVVTDCAFSPDQRYILTADWNNDVQVWDSTTGHRIRRFLCKDTRQGQLGFCALSPDMQRVLSTDFYHSLVLYDFNTGDEMSTLHGHTQYVYDCVFSPNGRFIATASMDQTLRIWDGYTGALLHTNSEHLQDVISCAFSPDGRFVISLSTDQTIMWWNTRTGEMLGKRQLASRPHALALHPWKPQAIIADDAGNLYLLRIDGINHSAIIVTAVNKNKVLTVHCPVCQQEHTIRQEQLGRESACLTHGCGMQFKLNTFVYHSGNEA